VTKAKQLIAYCTIKFTFRKEIEKGEFLFLFGGLVLNFCHGLFSEVIRASFNKPEVNKHSDQVA